MGSDGRLRGPLQASLMSALTELVWYVLLASAASLIFYVLFRAAFRHRRILRRRPDRPASLARGGVLHPQHRHLWIGNVPGGCRCPRGLDADVPSCGRLRLALVRGEHRLDDRDPRYVLLLDAPADAPPPAVPLLPPHTPPVHQPDAVGSLCVQPGRGVRAGRDRPANCLYDPGPSRRVRDVHGLANHLQCAGALRL